MATTFEGVEDIIRDRFLTHRYLVYIPPHMIMYICVDRDRWLNLENYQEPNEEKNYFPKNKDESRATS